MENAIALTELASAVLGSVFLAGLLEWLCLRGLMGLMPARAAHPAKPARAMNPARVRPANRKLLQVSRLRLHG
jgi:hypothetical protein